MSWRAWLPLAPLCAMLLAGAGRARAEEPVLDEEFLEFLGSLDSDDEAWGELLESARERDQMKSEKPEAEVKAAPKQVDP
ncbi:MAG TPA: hypothetical protein VJ764_04245 [Steroidobacteraceae bacterium]|nr:hypothetical protein [Steroidobacteraceae bacterium]